MDVLNEKRMLTLDDMDIIHDRLTSFIIGRMSKFYKPILRKMFAEVFSKKSINYINNNIDKCGALLYGGDGPFYSLFIRIDYYNESGICKEVSIKKDDIKDLLPKNVTLNINYIKINERTVNASNLRKYYDALNMLYFSINMYKLNRVYTAGWGNMSISKYYRKPISYLKKHNVLMYSILVGTPINTFFSTLLRSKDDIMDIYKYYSLHFGTYTNRFISFLRYIKAYKQYIIKELLAMKCGGFYEKDYKK